VIRKSLRDAVQTPQLEELEFNAKAQRSQGAKRINGEQIPSSNNGMSSRV
jgi:hypothetical protein